jgi:SAM-dependent methyltransferase
MATTFEAEIQAGERFAFGKNWLRFLEIFNEDRLRQAEQSLREMLDVQSLEGKSFIDVGCGSGLFSLAARKLGAKVRSFDFDPQSVACTQEMKRRYSPDDDDWTIERGSVLDSDFLKSLGTFDVVYSWGVLHHTGQMWQALANVAPLVASRGKLFIAIYNDQGRASRTWLRTKQLYNKLPGALRWLVLGPAFVRLWGPTTVRDILKGQPFRTWRDYADRSMRGMAAWPDVVDWVGGLPFEVARPEQIFDFYQSRSFSLRKMTTCAGGHGCNQYVFEAAE